MKNFDIQNRRFFLITLTITISLLEMATTSSIALAKCDNIPICANTSKTTLQACHKNVEGDFWISLGKCSNLSEHGDRKDCKAEAATARKDDWQQCREQYEARLDVCEMLGESPYDPKIDPGNFVDPTQIGGAVPTNRYFPLIAGITRVYRGDDEKITISITKQTKVILGVTCIVVHDVVENNGQVIENTIDWFAQDIEGNVWYFGEISQDFENGELVSLEGSWKAGVNGAKPGIIMKASPQVEDVYRQEFALGEAEDLAQVLSLTASAIVPAASCNGTCLKTKDFTPIDPEAFEHKYYAPDKGLILEINPETGKRTELVDIQVN